MPPSTVLVQVGVPELDTSKYPSVPAAVAFMPLVPSPYKIPSAVKELRPVPPSDTVKSVIPVMLPPVIAIELSSK